MIQKSLRVKQKHTKCLKRIFKIGYGDICMREKNISIYNNYIMHIGIIISKLRKENLNIDGHQIPPISTKRAIDSHFN